MASRARACLFIPLIALFCASAPAHAQEWTRFRGPNGTGISTATTVPTEYSPTTCNWRVQLPGAGHSSPVLWGDKIFLTSGEETAGKRHVLCLNAKDGKQVWIHTYDFSAYNHHRLNSAASNTPTVDAERVYVIWTTPDSFSVHALDHSGKEVWKRDLGALKTQHGGAGSPLLVGDVLIVRSDSDEDGPECFIMGLNPKTGQTLWKQGRVGKTASYSTPILYEPKGGEPEVIFTSNAHGMTSLNPKTGAINWEMPEIFKQRCVGGAVVTNGLIFATAGNGGGERQGVAVRPGGKGAAAKVEYSIPKGVPYVPSPIVVGNLMFLWGDGGIVTCVRANTGETVWTERAGGNFYSSPVCVNNKLYCVNGKGELVVIEASEQFKLVARSDLGETCHATPAVANGVMYLRTESHLISLGGKK